MKVEMLEVPFTNRERSNPRSQAMSRLGLRLQTFRYILDTCLPAPAGRSAVDLGAGHGMFAQLARKKGYRVTSVDARAPWTLQGAEVPETADALDGIEFIQSDIRDFDPAGYDVILNIGLLYHLTLGDQIDLLTRSAARPVILDTEVYDAASVPADERARFSDGVEQDGYSGALMAETGDVWSSFDNTSSFWHTEESILKMFANVGFKRTRILEPAYRSRFGPRRWYLLDANT